MFMLHFWYASDLSWISEENMYLSTCPTNLYLKLGAFGNVCVSLFAFLTGYSFVVAKEKWDNRQYREKKIVSFLCNYWFYLIIIMFIAIFFHQPLPDLKQFALELTGINTSVGAEYTNITFAWYVSFYLFIVILYPIIKKINEFPLKYSVIIAISICFICKGISYFHIENWMWNSFWQRSINILSVIVGGYFARYSLFNRLFKKVVKNKVKSLSLISILTIGLLLLRIYFGNQMVDFWGTIYSIYIIFIMYAINQGHVVNTRVLETFGKYSMGMWYLSSFFFLPSGITQKYAYFPRYAEIIIVWVLVSTLFGSYVLQKIYDKIKFILYQKSKLWKWKQ